MWSNDAATDRICPLCHEPGLHATVEECIDVLRKERDQLKAQQQRREEPSIRYLGRYVPSFYP